MLYLTRDDFPICMLYVLLEMLSLISFLISRALWRHWVRPQRVCGAPES